MKKPGKPRKKVEATNENENENIWVTFFKKTKVKGASNEWRQKKYLPQIKMRKFEKSRNWRSPLII
jgi:hypothetical protein